jgi:hypothetical protein
MSLAQLQQDRADRARRRRALLVAEMAAATTEPEPYAVAPLDSSGTRWTVVTPDATERIRPEQDWTLTVARFAAAALTALPKAAVQFEWVAV